MFVLLETKTVLNEAEILSRIRLNAVIESIAMRSEHFVDDLVIVKAVPILF